MSILRYYKVIESYEFAPSYELLWNIDKYSKSRFKGQYLQCHLAPVRNHDEWSIFHPRIRKLRWG